MRAHHLRQTLDGFCAQVRPSRHRLWHTPRSGSIDLTLPAVDVLPLETAVDEICAMVRHTLIRQGTPTGPNDLLITAHALSRELTVVTANTSEFSRVPGLTLERWISG